ncbi:MAG: imidazolonepropionase [Actinobacteria bacterium]|uniref:imidazolonepropionase n=1 Tax=freshwater metagenome TaxID=449393 RepID=A0A6J6NEF8_9ZZZZ|nr:imidazolonepropionase [Actinomycetota bacterium]
MSQTLIKNIGLLVTNNSEIDGTPLGLINNAALLVEDGEIKWIGASESAPSAERSVDASGKCVIPGFVDSHNHLIFAGDRSKEFAARMIGQKYEAGGIAYTVDLTRKARDGDLLSNAQRLQHEAMHSGTTTIEIKSGYGLTVKDEVRSLSIAKQLTTETTFLGAHVVPSEYKDKADDYVDLVCGQMLTEVKPHAKWIDVFCDRGAFTTEQARKVLKAGIAAGLQPRLHANQLEQGDGVALGVELDAASVDHLSHFNQSDIEKLVGSKTVATLLPGAEFSTRSKYPDARKLLEAGVTVALAADCNPGSSYTTNMPLMIALAVREMFMTPEQALWSATKGGAQALRRNDVGHLSVGAKADFVILKESSYIHLAYRPGVNLIDEVWQHGAKI